MTDECQRPTERRPDVSGREPWKCRRCGNCCRGSGNVWVTARAIAAMADFLGVDDNAFRRGYTEVAGNRRGLVLKDGADGHCIFLSASGLCRVHAHKPRQCREFPHRWTHPGYEHYCAAERAALQ